MSKTTQSPGRIKAIYGVAGTAKTTVACGIADAFRKDGRKPYGTAQAGVAAKNFAEKTGVESDTVRMTLMRLYPTTTQLAKHHVTQLYRAARGLPTHKFDRLHLDSRSVMFADEASMIGTRDFALLTKACDQAGARMVLIGDNRQLPAIEQGGAFGSILQRVGGFELTQIKRQHSHQERERVEKLSRGETEEVLKAYADDRRLYVAATHAKAQEKLIADWSRRGGVETPMDHAILAATHVEINRLNDLAQQARLRAGKLSTWQSVSVGDETFFKGDRVLFFHKSRKHHLENGDKGTIFSIHNNPAFAAIRVRLDGEKTTRNIPLRTLMRTEYDGLTRGYATSVHAAQGCSVEHSYCHLSGQMVDRELTYVALSRHKDSVRIYTDENHAGVALTNRAHHALGYPNRLDAKPGLQEDYSPLIQQAAKSRAKTLAVDHQEPLQLTLSPEP